MPLVDQRTAETVGLFGPTVQFLTEPDDGVPCVMRGTVPPGAIAPLHSHADPETFLPIEGELEALVDSAWVRVGPGDVFHVPGGAKHAFRNPAGGPAVMTIVSTARIGRFFREVGTAPNAGPPTPELLEHFAATSARHGYWNATLEENLAVGLDLTGM